jgi:hypothetical protein
VYWKTMSEFLSLEECYRKSGDLLVVRLYKFSCSVHEAGLGELWVSKIYLPNSGSPLVQHGRVWPASGPC